MSIDLDAIIGNTSHTPYADSQPDKLNLTNKRLTRMPPLATPDGINTEFQEFFDKIVAAILSQKYYDLHTLSDMSLSEADFNHIIEENWDNHWMSFYMCKPESRGLDIELNMDRFQDIHRNMVGGFNIMTYHLAVKPDEFSDGKNITELTVSSTELLFTYKLGSGFQIITTIKPFTNKDEMKG